MQRRDFLKLLSASGMAMMTPLSLKAGIVNTGLPAYVSGSSTLLICLHASGGWDPTLLCDPKGNASADPINQYDPAEIATFGNISCAPTVVGVDGNGATITGLTETFFANHYQDMMVINGIDVGTLVHQNGIERTWSGKNSRHWATLPALHAAAHAENKALAHFWSGGYARTDDVVNQARLQVSSNNHLALDNLRRLIQPTLRSPNSGTGFSNRYQSDATVSRIRQAMLERLDRVQQQQTLPKLKQETGKLYAAKSSAPDLADLESFLPSVNDYDNLTHIERQAELTLSAFKAGVCQAADIYVGSFDTHSDNDQKQTTALGKLLVGLEYIITQAKSRGLWNRLVVMVGSDFARTNKYNSDNGKDHWSTGSLMFTGGRIKGNRVFGLTDDTQHAVGWDDLYPNLNWVHSGFSGPTTDFVPTMGDIHACLRRFLQISNQPLSRKGGERVKDYYPLEERIRTSFLFPTQPGPAPLQADMR